jgi:ParB/RepB/Spo0J family partition protein
MEELKAQIIGAGGILDPLMVEQKGKGEATYKLVNGERRYRALMELAEAGMKYPVPVHFVAPRDDKEVLQFALVSNEGVPLTTLDRALAYKQYVALGGERAALTTMLGKSKAHVTQMLTIANGSRSVHKQLLAGKLTVTEAYKLCMEEGAKATVEVTTEEPKQKASSVSPEAKEAMDKAQKEREEEFAERVASVVKEKDKKVAIKKEVSKAVKEVAKETGETLSPQEKQVLAILKEHGVDGFLAMSQRAVSLAEKASTTKKEKDNWKDVGYVLQILTEAMNEDSNWK